MLKEIFYQLVARYSTDRELAENLWQEIENKYSVDRYYHNLDHLENMYLQLKEVKSMILNWDTILFALFYHDIIYHHAGLDNEEKSAELAIARLSTIGFPKSQIDKCKEIILASKSHMVSNDFEVNYFTDADLSILGHPWEVYFSYSKNIRKEYSIYPDFIYTGGRKKVLRHYLGMSRIYKTSFFFDKFEITARENLARELAMLA
jgi:predicted metal-dependent HD superfamily phosphohydrolase